MNAIPKGLRAESLMRHMRALCKDIPRRTPTGAGERKAAEYVVSALDGMGLGNASVEPFKGIPTLGLPALLTTALCLAALPVGEYCGPAGKIVAGALLLFASVTFFQLLSCRPPLFHRLVERWDSQNVVKTIPAKGTSKGHVYLIGHLDANKQRFIFPPPWPILMKAMESSVVVLAAGTGAYFWASAFFGFNVPFVWMVAGASFLAFALLLAADEFQPTIEGANDNATAVSVLLGIGETLKDSPLDNADVTLLFTGCEEVGNHGMIAYLDKHAPPKEGTLWIDIEMVGTGNIAYATKHGISYLTEYRPGSGILSHAERAAKENPELLVTGRDMLILEEVSPLRYRGYDALCVVGYDVKGYLPHWHRVSDNLENIEPETLSRAARYVHAMLKTIDTRLGGV